MYTCIHVYIYTYKHTYIHTYVYTIVVYDYVALAMTGTVYIKRMTTSLDN